MNTIIGNSSYTYRYTQQTGKQNRARTGNGNWGRTAEPFDEDARILSTKHSGISAQEAYERSSLGKTLPEVGRDEECMDKSVEVSDTEQLPLTESEIEKVTDIEVVSLHNGVSFYYNCDTGELQCINHDDGRPGRHALWSKTISPEDWERCSQLFDRYADMAAGQFVYRYQAYLKHEDFWDMYLEGKVDLRALVEKDDALSETVQASMDNFRFAGHENFWEDYLNGNMDVNGFKEFLEGTNNGIPDYSFTVGDSMYIDKEKVQWAQYMNPLETKIYTAEEMAKMQAELIEKNTATLHKLSDPYSILYKKLVNPEYNGERIFREYPGGPLYTADEIMEVMNRNLKDAKYQAAARK